MLRQSVRISRRLLLISLGHTTTSHVTQAEWSLRAEAFLEFLLRCYTILLPEAVGHVLARCWTRSSSSISGSVCGSVPGSVRCALSWSSTVIYNLRFHILELRSHLDFSSFHSLCLLGFDRLGWLWLRCLALKRLGIARHRLDLRVVGRLRFHGSLRVILALNSLLLDSFHFCTYLTRLFQFLSCC